MSPLRSTTSSWVVNPGDSAAAVDPVAIMSSMSAPEEEEDEEEEEEEPAPVLTKGRQKKKRAARPGELRIKWTSKEEECLAEAWKVVCLDPTTGTNQSFETY